MVKLLVLDVDGTLVNKQKDIPEENSKAIKYAMKKGVQVALNTGRSHHSARQYALQLELNGPIISANGALIRESATGRILYKKEIRRETLEQIVLMAREIGCGISVYTGERIIADKMDEVIVFYQRDNSRLPEEIKFHVGLVPDLLEDEGAKQDGVLKVEISGLTEESKVLFHQRLSTLDGLSVIDCFGGGMEITDAAADKAQGAARLAEIFGIGQSEIMAMGDGPNDVAMLNYAGVSYVMGNARDCIRTLFKNVADTNYNSGVAKAIYAEI